MRENIYKVNWRAHIFKTQRSTLIPLIEMRELCDRIFPFIAYEIRWGKLMLSFVYSEREDFEEYKRQTELYISKIENYINEGR